jgi:hypothetical protein
VYWSAGAAIMRKPKAGGTVETVTTFDVSGRAPFIDSGRLYWSGWPNIYGMPLDATSPPVRLATRASIPDGWVAAGDRVFFASNIDIHKDGGLLPADELLVASSLVSEEPVVLLPAIEVSARMAADSTGVYWYDDERASNVEAGRPVAFIEKYTLATKQLVHFASADFADFLLADGAHVLWTDSASSSTVVWSNTPDGSHLVALGRAPLVRQLATDGTSAFWAESAPGDEFSDIVTGPVGGGPTRKIACHVASIYAFAVDETDLYYSTWLAPEAPGKMIGRIAKSRN